LTTSSALAVLCPVCTTIEAPGRARSAHNRAPMPDAPPVIRLTLAPSFELAAIR
jgi:hypothetical protein